MTTELNALVAKKCRLARDEMALICEIFASFEEEAERENLEEIKWGDALRSKFNGEVRRRVSGILMIPGASLKRRRHDRAL